MFKIEWDNETGGILLSSRVTKDTLGISPRPVWFEELDLLGLDKIGWTYPRCQDPLMWAVNKQYFYRGRLMFEAKGANIYDAPTINFQPGADAAISLEAVDVAEMLRRNKDQMFLIESEAIEFIRDTYIAYGGINRAFDAVKANQDVDYEALATRAEKRTKTKMAVIKEDCDSFDIVPLDMAKEQGKRVVLSTRIDRFIASFSGGKDSQVVLDLVTRAIPPTAFEVIYSDTGYELPPSLQLYEEVKKYYGERFPALKFTTTRNHESVLNYWDKIGTPSDTHRWCCSVMKTAPLYRSLKIEGTNRQARVLAFDGVRAEESTRRSAYNRIGKGVKHSTTINASPILQWNSTEIFLYLLNYQLPINPAYRKGVTRVGCVICPFSSDWNDMVINTMYPHSILPFLRKIENIVENSNIPDKDVYIKTGNWKRRAGGREIKSNSHLKIVSNKPDLIISLKGCHKKFYTWFPAIGEHVGNLKSGSIKFLGTIYPYIVHRKGAEIIITFPGSDKSPFFQGLVKKALYKATYCINCEACEVECPFGALRILPEPNIDKELCKHCQRCLNFHELGCIVAHSLKITSPKSSRMKLIGYNNFGLKEEWLDFFMTDPIDFFKKNDCGLNKDEQIPSLAKWLVHAEILDNPQNKELTELGHVLVDIYNDNPILVWEIIWINLSYNSPIAEWFIRSVPYLREFENKEINALVKQDYPETADKTIANVIYALLRTFRESPIGEEIGQYKTTSKQYFSRQPYHDLSSEAIAYSLYKMAEYLGTKELRVSSIYTNEDHGVKNEFGIDRNLFIKHLRSLHTSPDRVLIAELNMGLDHITLRDDLNAISVLKKLTE